MASSLRPARHHRAAFGIVILLTVLAAAGWFIDLQAQQWPVVKQGMWEFVRTMQPPGGGAPKTITSKKCTDPVADMQRQNANLSKSGCAISAPVKSGNTYAFSASCKVMGISSNTKSTITVESDSAYTLAVEGTTDGQPTKETMKARRTGDCGK
jgi:hypothetical protein